MKWRCGWTVGRVELVGWLVDEGREAGHTAIGEWMMDYTV
jgi:hypothetical protein